VIHIAKKSSQTPRHRHRRQNGLQYSVAGDVLPGGLRALSDLLKK
jgi:hypothetical protein